VGENVIKNMTMKRFILLLFIVTYQSCATKEFNRTYVLENGTNHEISITFYVSGDVKSEHHLTKRRAMMERIAELKRGGTSAEIAFIADSSVVIIDNVRIMMSNGFSVKPSSSRNILDDREYTIENNELYRFIFTEEDYNNAEDCGGQCD